MIKAIYKDPTNSVILNNIQELTDNLAINSNRYGMEIINDKCKVMINSNKTIQTYIYLYDCKLEEVDQFKYLGATLTKDGTSNQEIKIILLL